MFISIEDRNQVELEIKRISNGKAYIRSLIIKVSNERFSDLPTFDYDKDFLGKELYLLSKDNKSANEKIDLIKKLLEISKYIVNDEIYFTEAIGPLVFEDEKNPRNYMFLIDLKYNASKKTIDVLCNAKKLNYHDLISLIYYFTECAKIIHNIFQDIRVQNKFIFLDIKQTRE